MMPPASQISTSKASLSEARPAEQTASQTAVLEIDLMKLVVRLWSKAGLILLCAVLGFCAGALFSLTMHKTYVAQAVFLPPINADAVQTQSLLLRQDPSDLYLGMLGSRSVADDVIDSLHLMDVYHAKLRSQAHGALAGQSRFSVEKNALISVQVKTTDPQLSAAIANAYLDALYRLNGAMTASASHRRSEFFESQLADAKETLSTAESQMKAMEEKTGTVLPEGEAQAGVSATARLQATIEDDQARLSSLLTGSTDQNPLVVQLRAQIGALQSELRAQQMSAGAKPGTGLPSAAKMPGVMLEYLRSSRDLKEQEALYESLIQQYEKSRLGALDPGPQLQIVDRAVVPETKAGPPRTLIAEVSTLVGGIIGILLVLLPAPIRRFSRRYSEVAAGLRSR